MNTNTNPQNSSLAETLFQAPVTPSQKTLFEHKFKKAQALFQIAIGLPGNFLWTIGADDGVRLVNLIHLGIVRFPHDTAKGIEFILGPLFIVYAWAC